MCTEGKKQENAMETDGDREQHYTEESGEISHEVTFVLRSEWQSCQPCENLEEGLSREMQV